MIRNGWGYSIFWNIQLKLVANQKFWWSGNETHIRATYYFVRDRAICVEKVLATLPLFIVNLVVKCMAIYNSDQNHFKVRILTQGVNTSLSLGLIMEQPACIECKYFLWPSWLIYMQEFYPSFMHYRFLGPHIILARSNISSVSMSSHMITWPTNVPVQSLL